MRRALKDPINSFTSTLESFFLNGQPLGKDQIGHLGEPILMHSSEITSSQINPALGVKLTTWRSWSWLYSEQSARLSPGLSWREQQLLVLRLIPAIEPVEIHCLPQRHSSAHIWWGVYIRKSWVSPGSRRHQIMQTTFLWRSVPQSFAHFLFPPENVQQFVCVQISISRVFMILLHCAKFCFV